MISSKYLIKPLIFGATNAAVAYLSFGRLSTFYVNPFGMAAGRGYPVPGMIAAVGVGMATSIIVDLVHDFILKHIPSSEAWQSRELLALNAASGAGGLFLLYSALNPDGATDLGLGKVLATGAGSSVLSAYLDSFVEGKTTAF